jgi:imidazolonepropionase
VQESVAEKWDQVWAGANIATMNDGGAPYGQLEDAAIAVQGERIAWVGSAREGRHRAAAQRLDVHEAQGLWVTPGLIDCHTHLVYGGNRVAEFEQRLCGASYEDIARSGGGIQSTVRATRAAGAAELRQAALRRVRRLMAEGVTTIEIKSGYGLELAVERRLLEVARDLGEELPVTVRKTFLGLHALPPEFAAKRQQFVELVCGPWLKALTAAGLVDAVDAFCENIAFTPAETAQLLEAAQGLGLGAHVHAGQLTDMGAAGLAAQWGALSADHLEYVNAAGAKSMAEAGTVAVLLPAAYFTLRQSTPPPVPLFRETGVRMAVATDLNPGTSPCSSILTAMNMACTLFGLTPQEALSGTTRNAAHALGLQAEIGTIAAGKRADLAFWHVANPCAGVMYRGRLRDALAS